MNNQVIGGEGVVKEDTHDAIKLGFALWFEKKVSKANINDRIYIKWLVDTMVAEGLQKWEAMNKVIKRQEIKYLFL